MTPAHLRAGDVGAGRDAVDVGLEGGQTNRGAPVTLDGHLHLIRRPVRVVGPAHGDGELEATERHDVRE